MIGDTKSSNVLLCNNMAECTCLCKSLKDITVDVKGLFMMRLNETAF